MRLSWNKRKTFDAIREFVRLCLLLLACMVVMRPVFALEVFARLGASPKLFPTVLSGALFDLLLVGRIFVFGLLPFVLLHLFFPKLARGIFIGLVVLYVVVSALLAEYYCNLTMPLDHVIMVYSTEELKQTLFSSAAFSWPPLLWFLALMALPVLLIFLWRKLKVGKWLAMGVTVAFLLLTLLVPYNRIVRENKMYASYENFCLAVNHPSYTFLEISDYLKELKKIGFDDQELNQAVLAYQAVHPEFDYDTPGYPFYRKFNDPDVLGGFFDKTSDGLPPNFVFIIVEGLGRYLTGVYNPVMSFTPFLDSLASVGLYWPNALSTSARTFGVLPSVFASAPHGRYGFSVIPIARHQSLLKDLKRNGYTTAFFYGGDMTFGNYGLFMEENQVDKIFQPDLTVEDSVHYQLLMENHRWGLDDQQLIQAVIQEKTADSTLHRPFADVFLTLSTHEPFEVQGMEVFENQVKTMLDTTPDITGEERDNILKNINIFACYLYTDQCIRELVSYYGQQPDFANTVFVITGDHRMAFLSIGSPIHNFNVPLIVYSPLVKKPRTMLPVVSHLDVTPSLNAYLQSNYNYVVDDHCHWLGTSFDTVQSFRNTRKLLFMLNNRDVVDYRSGDYLLTRQYLVKIASDMTGTLVEDESLYQSLKQELTDLDMVSRAVVQQDILLPKGYSEPKPHPGR